MPENFGDKTLHVDRNPLRTSRNRNNCSKQIFVNETSQACLLDMDPQTHPKSSTKRSFEESPDISSQLGTPHNNDTSSHHARVQA
ncbi:hypothetical protein A2U01_0005066 [Trifolium medium]|uniref:Uncharacterized protein n=1 Tax=Trifolium medium TaxID=97028 RepID=A0A392MAV2_9FABA|nr:hypothetical protein [Trifolium medium]